MALNRVILQGRIPTSDKLIYEIRNSDDEKKAFFRGNISVQRSYKKPEEEYYPEDLLFFKAFGSTAIFIDKYINRGDYVILEGELRKDDNYEKDGQTVYGQMYVHVSPQGVHFQRGNLKDENTAPKTAVANTSSAITKGTNPLTAKNPFSKLSNPLRQRSVV